MKYRSDGGRPEGIFATHQLEPTLLRRHLGRGLSGAGLEAAPRPVTVGRLCELVPVIENLRYPTSLSMLRITSLAPSPSRCYSLVLAASDPVLCKMRPKARGESANVPTTRPNVAAAGPSRLRPAYKIRGSGLDSRPAPRPITGDDLTPGFPRQGNRPSRSLEYSALHILYTHIRTRVVRDPAQPRRRRLEAAQE